jgi:hypothetical protein
MATHNLCQYLPHPLMLLLLILTLPLMLAGQLEHLPLATLGLVGLVPPLLYVISQKALYPDWKRRLLAFPVLMLLGTGITWNNTRAVLRALTGRPHGFQRTPKFAQIWHQSNYALKADSTLWGEMILAAYSIFGVALGLYRAPSLAPYLALYALSFSVMTAWGLYDLWQVRRHHPVMSASHKAHPAS